MTVSDVVQVRHIETGQLMRLDVVCPRHGTFAFPPDSLEVHGVAVEHGGCVAVPAEVRRQTRRVWKSRRSPLVHLLPAAGPTGSDAAGKAAPGHMGVTLGFAPAARREWRSPGPVRLEEPADRSWVTFEKRGLFG